MKIKQPGYGTFTDGEELLKDAIKFHVFRNMKEALYQISVDTRPVSIETKAETVVFSTDEIVMVENEGRKVLVHTLENLMLISAMMLLFSNMLLFAGYQLVKQKDEAKEIYFRALEEKYDEQRVVIHDIRRHLTAIKGLAQEQGADRVAEYASTLEGFAMKKGRCCLFHCQTLASNRRRKMGWAAI